LPWLEQRDRGACPIVHDLGGAHAGAILKVVESKTGPRALNVGCVYAVSTHEVDCSLADLVVWDSRDHAHWHTKVGQADEDVALATAVGGLKVARLHEALALRGGEAKHHLAEGDD
jgi:hypothetical protein